ncbi:MAG: hypothetical protein LBB72_02605, partial [Spirochaetaceae bacterium]|nr:hypothetical protein [Spirochaetaceae bacterium]
VAADFEEYARQTTILKNKLDWQASMVGAKREGIQEGRNEAKLEDARKMKADNMSVSQISKYTGLPTETIAQL